MEKILGGLILLVLSTSCALAVTERSIQRKVCKGMEQEHVLPNGNRIDCLNKTHAIEVDFTNKWAEAVGQSLHYSGETGKKPGVILICKSSMQSCLSHSLSFQSTIAKWRLCIDLWLCDTESESLEDCRYTRPSFHCP